MLNDEDLMVVLEEEELKHGADLYTTAKYNFGCLVTILIVFFVVTLILIVI